MDDELIERAKEIHQERLWGAGNKGPLYGAELASCKSDAVGFHESFRSLVETIAVLQARIERLEKQQ